MGDGGAYFLGFLVGCLTISSSEKGTVFAALIAPLFVLALPILDTTLAILRRGFQGLPLFRADRGHIHHRLLETGMPRRQVVLGIYAFTAIFLALGFTAFWWHGEHLAILLGLGMLIMLLAAGQLNFSREWFAVGRILGNSMNMRAEIQYALAQTRWLVMEGARCESLAALCEDAVFIARKLGFDTVRIRLEDQERTWPVPAAGGNHHFFRHPLPGHVGCFIELGVACPKAGDGTDSGDKAKIAPSIVRANPAHLVGRMETEPRPPPARFPPKNSASRANFWPRAGPGRLRSGKSKINCPRVLTGWRLRLLKTGPRKFPGRSRKRFDAGQMRCPASMNRREPGSIGVLPACFPFQPLRGTAALFDGFQRHNPRKKTAFFH